MRATTNVAEEMTMYVADIQSDTITRLRSVVAGEEGDETATNPISEDQTSAEA
jgi:hypothetical protein